MKTAISILLFAIMILAQTACAQKQKPYFGWDLSYESVLEKNNVGKDEWLQKWLNFTYKDGFDGKFETPTKKWISEWNGEPIISSILIDYPAFHAAEHYTLWLVRTEKNAYYWNYLDQSNSHFKKTELELAEYDKLYEQMSVWEQYKPSEPEKRPEDHLPGFIGFLSLYDKGESRQMLFTWKDIIECEREVCGEAKIGRLLNVLAELEKKEKAQQN